TCKLGAVLTNIAGLVLLESDVMQSLRRRSSKGIVIVIHNLSILSFERDRGNFKYVRSKDFSPYPQSSSGLNS
ncbi:MAG: hypothetical protein ACRC62_29010, partial [Microcoleus sp.]